VCVSSNSEVEIGSFGLRQFIMEHDLAARAWADRRQVILSHFSSSHTRHANAVCVALDRAMLGVASDGPTYSTPICANASLPQRKIEFSSMQWPSLVLANGLQFGSGCRAAPITMYVDVAQGQIVLACEHDGCADYAVLSHKPDCAAMEEAFWSGKCPSFAQHCSGYRSKQCGADYTTALGE